MIIWSGLGFLVVVFLFGAAFICSWAFDTALGAGYYSAHKWTMGAAMFIAAGLSWIVGSLLRKRTAQIVIDKATGREIVLNRANHSFFFIPMDYWGGIFAAISLVLCVMEFIK